MATGNKKGGGRKLLVADRRYSSSAAKPGPKKKAAKPKSAKPAARSSARKARRAPNRAVKPRGILRWLLFPLRWLFRIIWAVIWRMGLVAGLCLAGAIYPQYAQLPDVSALLDGRNRGSVTLLDHEGDIFAWRGDQFGGVVTADTVSPHLKNAFVATEDKRFFRHFGLSPRGIASAVRINLSEGRGPLSGHGGSTITQQTAKLMCLGTEYDPNRWKSEAAYEADCRRGSVWRKAKEAIFALAMEVKYTKDEILSIYMNRAYMGGGAYGVEAAAQRYFGKSANQVNASEAAMMAGLLTAPTTLAPTNNLQRSRDRAATVLRLMEEQGYLTAEQRRLASAAPASLSAQATARAGGYFADWVMDKIPAFLGNETTEDVVIRTTLDQRLQKAAETALVHVFENKVRTGSKAQAAIVVMSADGAVRAMVGGRNLRASGLFNRATQAKRQTGSAFKPFVYATALELGYSPLDRVLDAEYCLQVPGSGNWCPKNYTHKFYGEVTMARALRESLNVPAVKVSEAVGRDKVRLVAEEFGIESDLAAGPALALGASEASLLEMTGAYAGILNGGSAVTPYGVKVLSLVGEGEPLIGKGGGMGERVIRDDAARALVWMMRQVIEEGTGTRAQIPGWEAAGKSGTTSAAKDAWFVGFTADYVAGVWMGYDDNTPLTGVTGGGLPAEIWKETMVRVHKGLTPRPLPALAPTPVAEPDPAQPSHRNKPNLGRRIERGVERTLDGFFRDIFGN
ncbi:MAG: PBP1A family penicillin-binding protein [Epibacterium sp.]|nr:PBP1A family penicillin-binding protein [Epibacterium sp.]NQX75315.1 PBP1A family penicillin-binding protein [Epibacterium sp.]